MVRRENNLVKSGYNLMIITWKFFMFFANGNVF